MQIVYDEESLREYFATAARASEDRPVLIDRFLEDATEVDVDAIRDHTGEVLIGGENAALFACVATFSNEAAD